jgi:hypothetical protein
MVWRNRAAHLLNHRLEKRMASSGLGITLFFPRIAAVVIAADFPVARCIVVAEFDALQPLGAFPEIEMRHHQPHRAAVFLLQRRAGP